MSHTYIIFHNADDYNFFISYEADHMWWFSLVNSSLGFGATCNNQNNTIIITSRNRHWSFDDFLKLNPTFFSKPDPLNPSQRIMFQVSLTTL